MPGLTPIHCRRSAMALFAEQMPVVVTQRGLLRAACAIALHEMGDLDLTVVESKLQGIADTIRGRVRGDDERAIMAHAHDVLFEEFDFAGNTNDYFSPDNSYVPIILDTKRGLPISLTLIYKDVLSRLGIVVHGVNAAAHFLAAVETRDRTARGDYMLVDPFHRGRILTTEEAFDLIETMIGQSLPEPQRVLPIATHRLWLGRMLANLHAEFLRQGQGADAAAMEELAMCLRLSEPSAGP